MKTHRSSRWNHHRAIAPIVLIYLLAGASWLFLSDRIVEGLGLNQIWLQAGKGWLLVATTAALLYCLSWRLLLAHESRTERRQADRDALLARYQLLAENATDVIWTMSLDGRFTYVSPSVYELRGYRPEEALGQSIEEAVCEESLQRIKPAFEHALARAASGEGDVTSVNEVEQPCKDGSTVWTEATARLTLDENGVPNGIIGVSRSIGDRRRAAAALRASEERFRLAAQSAGDLIYERELLTGCVEFFGDIDARQGYGPGEFPRTVEGWKAHMHPTDAERVMAEMEQAARAQRKFEASYGLRRRDGTYTEWMDRGLFQYDEAGAAVRLVGAATDVTAARRSERENAALQEQLQQAMKMEAIGRLAGGVAHDFNNLLTAIQGNVELARFDLQPGHPVLGSLEEIEKAARSAADLTRQLLAFSRKQVIAPTALDVNDLVEGTRRLLSRLLGEDVELRLTLNARPATIMADRGQLEQVLVNLAVNARDAMPRGGTLRIETALVHREAKEGARNGNGASVALSLIDTGVGIDDGVRWHLFEPFFTTKPRGKGTGLGLATSYGAVQQMGGTIEVDSAPGAGSTFRVLLPLADAAAVAPQRSSDSEPLRGGHETVLLVEDAPLVRDLASRMLDMLGYRVLSASDGTQALHLARSHEGPLDLLLTDVVMPGMNGRELAQELRSIRPETKVLFASGYAEDVIAHRGALEEGIEFLAKPFTVQSLAKAVRQALGANGVPGVGARTSRAE